MMVTRVLSATIAACCASGASAELWEQWKAEHGKAYSSQDVEASRRGVFLQNLEHFAERSRFDTAAYGPDMWSDLTLAEFKAQQAGCFTEEGVEVIPTAALPLLPLDADGKPPSVEGFEENSLNDSGQLGTDQLFPGVDVTPEGDVTVGTTVIEAEDIGPAVDSDTTEAPADEDDS